MRLKIPADLRGEKPRAAPRAPGPASVALSSPAQETGSAAPAPGLSRRTEPGAAKSRRAERAAAHPEGPPGPTASKA